LIAKKHFYFQATLWRCFRLDWA